jgi:hypothetical protein
MFEGVNWIHPALDRNQWHNLMNTVMTFGKGKVVPVHN